MVKTLVKLALTALIASAAWRIGSEYLTHYRFRESVRRATSENRLERELRQEILEEAASADVPMTDEDLTIRMDERHTAVSGSYVKTIEILPGYERPWTFDWTVETYNAPTIGSPVAP